MWKPNTEIHEQFLQCLQGVMSLTDDRISAEKMIKELLLKPGSICVLAYIFGNSSNERSIPSLKYIAGVYVRGKPDLFKEASIPGSIPIELREYISTDIPLQFSSSDMNPVHIRQMCGILLKNEIKMSKSTNNINEKDLQYVYETCLKVISTVDTPIARLAAICISEIILKFGFLQFPDLCDQLTSLLTKRYGRYGALVCIEYILEESGSEDLLQDIRTKVVPSILEIAKSEATIGLEVRSCFVIVSYLIEKSVTMQGGIFSERSKLHEWALDVFQTHLSWSLVPSAKGSNERREEGIFSDFSRLLSKIVSHGMYAISQFDGDAVSYMQSLMNDSSLLAKYAHASKNLVTPESGAYIDGSLEFWLELVEFMGNAPGLQMLELFFKYLSDHVIIEWLFSLTAFSRYQLEDSMSDESFGDTLRREACIILDQLSTLPNFDGYYQVLLPLIASSTSIQTDSPKSWSKIESGLLGIGIVATGSFEQIQPHLQAFIKSCIYFASPAQPDQTIINFEDQDVDATYQHVIIRSTAFWALSRYCSRLEGMEKKAIRDLFCDFMNKEIKQIQEIKDTEYSHPKDYLFKSMMSSMCEFTEIVPEYILPDVLTVIEFCSCCFLGAENRFSKIVVSLLLESLITVLQQASKDVMTKRRIMKEKEERGLKPLITFWNQLTSEVIATIQTNIEPHTYNEIGDMGVQMNKLETIASFITSWGHLFPIEPQKSLLTAITSFFSNEPGIKYQLDPEDERGSYVFEIAGAIAASSKNLENPDEIRALKEWRVIQDYLIKFVHYCSPNVEQDLLLKDLDPFSKRAYIQSAFAALGDIVEGHIATTNEIIDASPCQVIIDLLDIYQANGDDEALNTTNCKQNAHWCLFQIIERRKILPTIDEGLDIDKVSVICLSANAPPNSRIYQFFVTLSQALRFDTKATALKIPKTSWAQAALEQGFGIHVESTGTINEESNLETESLYFGWIAWMKFRLETMPKNTELSIGIVERAAKFCAKYKGKNMKLLSSLKSVLVSMISTSNNINTELSSLLDDQTKAKLKKNLGLSFTIDSAEDLSKDLSSTKLNLQKSQKG